MNVHAHARMKKATRKKLEYWGLPERGHVFVFDIMKSNWC